MPVIPIPGRLAKLQLSSDGGTTYLPVGGIVDINMDIKVDEMECTTHDSGGVREYIPNFSDVTLDVKGRWLDGDPGQQMILDSIDAKSTLLFIFTMESTQGKKVFTGGCFATQASPSAPLDDTAGMDVNFRCSGVTRATQSTAGSP